MVTWLESSHQNAKVPIYRKMQVHAQTHYNWLFMSFRGLLVVQLLDLLGPGHNPFSFTFQRYRSWRRSKEGRRFAPLEHQREQAGDRNQDLRRRQDLSWREKSNFFSLVWSKSLKIHFHHGWFKIRLRKFCFVDHQQHHHHHRLRISVEERSIFV